MQDHNITSSLVFQRMHERKIFASTPNNPSKLNISIQYEMHRDPSPEAYQKIMSQNFNRREPTPKKIINTRNLKSRKELLEDIQIRVSSPKRVVVQFDIERRRKSHIMYTDSAKDAGDKRQCEELITESLNKYLGRINRERKRKMMRCNDNQFGLDIRKIKYDQTVCDKIADKMIEQRERNIAHLKTSIDLSFTRKQTTKFQNEHVLSLENPVHTTEIKKKCSFRKNDKPRAKELNSVDARFNRMINFLGLVLYSYHCYMLSGKAESQLLLNPVRSKKMSRYTFYVGKGNNKNLIRSLMKKRWWWVETDDLQSAHFVWTQLRSNSLESPKDNADIETDEKQFVREMFNIPITKQFRKMNQCFRFQDLSKMFHSNFKHSSVFRSGEKNEDISLKQIKATAHFHNHYSANYMLGNKKALYNNLKQYCEYAGRELFDFLPLTFHIQNLQDSSWQQFEEYTKDQKKSLWIVKPGENSNQGEGIFISDCPTKIRGKLKYQKQQQHTYIIQKYIKNVFLFQRRKFDIRAYMLVVTIGGNTKFYWYSEGYIRTSSELYDLHNIIDCTIHLTNDKIQNRGSNYGRYECGNKVSFHQFQRYLLHNFKGKYSFNTLVAEMKQITRQTVLATYNKIDPNKKQMGFELFGMDFLVDSNFKPWLLEVNTNPCLELASPCLERLIPWVLENTFRISIDPLFPPSCQCPRSWVNFIPDNLLERNRFELIFDSMHDRDFEWESKCIEVEESPSYSEENQEFENDGDIIGVENF